MLLLVLLASVVAADIVFDVPKFPHPFKAALGDNMYLFWNKVGNEMSFEVHAKARGYVGVGISPSGSMTGADIALGWVKDGKGILLDLYAAKNGKPLLDATQNLEMVHAEEANGITLMHFKRPLDTGDCRHDIPITSDSLRIIWAYSDKDPESNDDLLYHEGRRGISRLHFLDHPETTRSIQLPSDLLSYDFLMPNVTIPKSKTTLYWCQVFPAPKLQKRYHVVKHARVLDNAPIVHHIIGYSCYGNLTNTSLHNIGFECFDDMMTKDMLQCSEASFGWAVGGEDVFFLPEDVGLPLGGPDDAKFFVFEMHYNNEENKDWIDRSGLRIWLTPTLRKYEAGTFAVGSPVIPTQIIPPNSEFTTHAFCPEECLTTVLAANKVTEIRAYSYLLHSHLLGRRIRVRHIRNGEQIGWFGKDEWYDFNQQQTRIFTEHKVVLPGDQFVAECVYNSTDRKTVTYGGHTTREEMCLAFFQYYPRLNFGGCGSFVGPSPQVKIFGNIELNATWQVVKPEKDAGKSFQDVINEATWNPSLVSKLQQVQVTTPHVTYCIDTKGEMLINTSTSLRQYPTFKMMKDASTCSANTCLFSPIVLIFIVLASSFSSTIRIP